jgi:predicted alpha-1,2-mannosidase
MIKFFPLKTGCVTYFATALFLFLQVSCSPRAEQKTAETVHLSDYVNPFIGASTSTKAAGVHHGLGKTFPGAATPFGMVQVSPNTVTGGDNGPGYSFEHKTIEGFAFTQMSGIGWYGDLGNLLVMPTAGAMHTNSGKENGAAGYRSFYDKSSETASAGYYAVTLSDHRIKAEATASPHCGMLRFTYPRNKQSRIQIDLARRVGGTSTFQAVKVIDEHTIAGRMVCTPDGGGWGNGDGQANYTVYFYAQFSKPLKSFGVWSVDIPEHQSRKREFIESAAFQQLTANAKILQNIREYEGKHIGFFSEFETEADEEVLFKSGISFVSEAGAEKNLQAEMQDWDFDAVRSQARALWHEALSKIEVSEGTEDQKIIFYTSLYHTMIDPRIFSDVDGAYPGADGKNHRTDSFVKRTIFSGWDVFRSQIPLQTIINPALVNDLLLSLTTLAEESGRGYYERWEFLNAYSGCMLGNPAISVLADAYAKGICRFDPEKAYQYAVNTSKMFGNSEQLGYTPNPQSISRTLEHAYSEWCMSRLAEALGKPEDAARYAKLSLSYKNLYDPEKHSFRPREADGSFQPWPAEGKLREGYGTTESNELQQGWFVPHDIQGMAELMGGREQAIADLDTMFAKTPDDFLWNAYYNHANEPVHHVPYLYNRLGQPWKTQQWSRFICEKAYKNKVEGLVGNEDVGQMSAWYVLSACGIYPVCPGETRYEITGPLFGKTTLRVGNGKAFVIKAKHLSAGNVYIQSAKLNGEKYSKCYLDYKDIMTGGVLELEMGDTPNTAWGLF